MSDPKNVFQGRTVWLVGVLGLASLVLSLFLMARADDPTPTISKPSALSRSSLGYRALARLLERLGVEVQVRRFAPEERVDQENVLLLFEPEEEYQSETLERAKEVLSQGATVVLVLPKWSATSSDKDPGWVVTPNLLPLETPSALLSGLLALPKEEVVLLRPMKTQRWSALLADGEQPELEEPQLMSLSLSLKVIVASDEGILLGSTSALGGELFVVSDPDLLNTHGIVRGENAVIAYRLFLERLHPKSLIFDETIHGLRYEPSLWRVITEPPLLWMTLQVLAFFVLGVWAGLFRFGSPEPLPPRLQSGKEILVESTAALLASRGELWPSLRKYHQKIMVEVASASAIPLGEDVSQALPQLARLGRQRKTTADIEVLSLEIGSDKAGSPLRALVLAGILYGWRKEMLHGTS
jgi:Domain of unknown function (DUF4350)